jgi:hypothetical protein
MRHWLPGLTLVLGFTFGMPAADAAPRVSVTFSQAVSQEPLTNAIAFFGLDADGYPRRIWDREKGEVDPVSAEYWREIYDLAHILQRDWATLGPKLRGKLRKHCWNGDHSRDNAYSRLRYPQMVLPWVVDCILDTAPPGADVDSWRY